MQTPMPNIDEVVELLGLEIDPKSNRNSDTYNVRCPLCGDKKFHMNSHRFFPVALYFHLAYQIV